VERVAVAGQLGEELDVARRHLAGAARHLSDAWSHGEGLPLLLAAGKMAGAPE
jgi:hypothetical protein